MSLAHYLGIFYYSWSAFEINLEMISKRELGISNRQSHIVFGSLSFTAKMEIALSLLKDSDRPQKDNMIAAIRQVPKVARRNHITHSLITTNPDFSRFVFHKRNIAKGLSTKTLDLNTAAMNRHFDKLNAAANEVERLAGFTADDRKAYVDSATAAV